MNQTGNLKAFILGAGCERVCHILRRIPKTKVNSFQFQPACFDLGKIQNIIKDSQQSLGAVKGCFKEIPLFGGELRFEPSSSMPITPFMGVRSSWLIFARNSLLARLASSASLRALSSSVMS